MKTLKQTQPWARASFCRHPAHHVGLLTNNHGHAAELIGLWTLCPKLHISKTICPKFIIDCLYVIFTLNILNINQSSVPVVINTNAVMVVALIQSLWNNPNMSSYLHILSVI